ncbi:LytR C-terminal domain-containing protein [Streptomyces sp. DSM 44915]|uniref:LytR C-terminal domain-containing protein n=1 Tax=Streptomyces chisholmiae TaxID=3075540 RepID=A0ABU2JQE8_9ACTN|nr:LytR C-terminal domain-containing protein [Streptomyces sp. DSM 44915]MDT0267207.1 LytR C-terminal domain-containing protein [Streptomyces sp. DSM 44915]
MSMLTPPGMGGKKFRVTGDRYPKMRRPRRHRRRVLAAVGAVAAVGLLGFGTLQLVDVFTGGDSAEGSPRARPAAGDAGACQPADGDAEQAAEATLPEPTAVTVNVYNATTRTGLAQDTADALAERGFTIGAVSNAPEELDGQVSAPGLVLGSEAANASGAVALLTTQLADAETGDALDVAPVTDQAADDAADDADPPATDPAAAVDLVLGDGFTELTSAEEAETLLADLAARTAADDRAEDC